MIILLEGIEDYYLKKYLTDGESIYGYVTGIHLANKLNLMLQVPYTIEVCTNNFDSEGFIHMEIQSLYLMKPTIEVTRDNYKMLQVLDMMEDISYSRHYIEETGKRIKRYLNGYTVNEDMLSEALVEYSQETKDNLIVTGLYEVLLEGK